MFIARQTRTETCTLRTGFIRCRKRHSFPVRASCPQASDIVGGESSGGRGVSRTECTVFQFRLPLSTVYRYRYLPFADSRICYLQIAVSTLTDAYIYTCRYGGAGYFFAVHGSLNAISRSSFKGAELPEYFVRTMTVV